jgi:hypothetical protein
MNDIVRCRTPALGGSLFRCDDCDSLDYSYHSCRNRHCPKCHHNQTERWLEKLRSRLLPCNYYLLTFTVPDELSRTIRSNQRVAYSILLQQAAAAVLTLAAAPQWVGGRPGILGLLHSWSRTLSYHPHVHLLLTAGGLTDDGAWIKPANRKFLFPGYALSRIFRAKIRDAFRRADLDHDLDHDHDHGKQHQISWAGLLLGLVIHSLLDGVALYDPRAPDHAYDFGAVVAGDIARSALGRGTG